MFVYSFNLVYSFSHDTLARLLRSCVVSCNQKRFDMPRPASSLYPVFFHSLILIEVDHYCMLFPIASVCPVAATSLSQTQLPHVSSYQSLHLNLLSLLGLLPCAASLIKLLCSSSFSTKPNSLMSLSVRTSTYICPTLDLPPYIFPHIKLLPSASFSPRHNCFMSLSVVPPSKFLFFLSIFSPVGPRK